MCAGGSVTEERYHFHGEKESRGRAVFRHHDDLPCSVVSQRTETARDLTGSRLRLATRPADLEEDFAARRCTAASGLALCASVEAGCPSRKMGRVLQQRTFDPTGG